MEGVPGLAGVFEVVEAVEKGFWLGFLVRNDYFVRDAAHVVMQLCLRKVQ